jgi:hypothetical protein
MEQDDRGLMAFWSDIDPGYARFREWHNCEHIPERVGIPGFRTGQRYRCIGPGRKFLMFYETDNPEVLQSQAYLDRLNNPTPWTRESLQHFRNPLRNLYRKLAEDGERPGSAPPYLVCARFDLPGADPAGREQAISGFCTGLRTSRTRRARIFEINEAASKVPTKERAIYGEQPESQRFLLLLDEPVLAEAAALAALKERAAAAGAVDFEAQCYWVEFFLGSPEAAR